MQMLRILPAALAILFLISCNKLVDHIKDHLDGDDKTYRIETWTLIDHSGQYRPGKITYNENNDPLSVTFDTATNNIHWLFNYDKHGRLSKSWKFMSDPYFEEFYDEYRIYKYNNKGQIVSDTNYSYGWWDTIPTPQNTYFWETFYTYDPKGRLIQYVEKYPDLGPGIPANEITFNLTYDEDGNLVIPGAYVYDNKLSFMRTNKIWMFLNRNYSVNNPIPAVSYNNRRLPLVFDYEITQPAWTTPTFLGTPFYSSTFTYKKIK